MLGLLLNIYLIGIIISIIAYILFKKLINNTITCPVYIILCILWPLIFIYFILVLLFGIIKGFFDLLIFLLDPLFKDPE